MYGPGSYFIGQEEIDEVLDVLKSGELSRYRSGEANGSGVPKVYQFERDFEDFTGAKHCLAVNSGTSALMASMAALGIGPGDEVIVPGYTFVASMSSVIYSRAIPVLAEVDESLTLDPQDVERKITPRTRAIMAVHMLGSSLQYGGDHPHRGATWSLCDRGCMPGLRRELQGRPTRHYRGHGRVLPQRV